MSTVKGFRVGNENLLYQDPNIAEEFNISENYTVGDYVINPDDGKLYIFTTNHAAGAWIGTDARMVVVTEEISDLNSAVNDPVSGLKTKAPTVYSTASGVVASFDDSIEGLSLKKLTVNIEPVQADGIPTQETPIPIDGWTGCTISQSGINLFDDAAAKWTTTYRIDTDGSIVSNNGYQYTKTFFPIKPNTTYTFTLKKADSGSVAASNNIAYYDKDKNFIERVQLIPGNVIGTLATTFTTPSNCAYYRLSITKSGITRLHIELGRKTTTWSEHQGTTLNINWQSVAGTVYSGSLIINDDGTGELKARPYYASYNGESLVGPWISSMEVYESGITPSNGAQVVDLGGVETVYQLTEQEVINTLEGVNNIWVDTGNIEIEYQVNTELGFDSLKDIVNKKVTPTVDLRKFAFAVSLNYIDSYGNLAKSNPATKWNTYWLRTSDIGEIITAESYGNNIAFKQLAFYSGSPSSSTFVSGFPFRSDTQKSILENVKIPKSATLCLFSNRVESGTDVVFEGTSSTAIDNYPKDAFSKYRGKMHMIGYSKVTNPYNYVINTAEMYNYIGQNAYDGIKGDVRVTSDNVLVMCHDAGFTFNSNGEIIDYDSSNRTLIKEMTFDQVQQLVFAQKTSTGADMHVPTFDDFVRMCKKWGKFCYPTIRDELMDIILPLMFETLDKYSMRESTIVNSLTYESLVALREIDTEIPLSYMVDVRSSDLPDYVVRYTTRLGNCAIGFFATLTSTTVSALESKISANADKLEIMKKLGIPIIGAQAHKKHLQSYLKSGFDFVQTWDYWDTVTDADDTLTTQGAAADAKAVGDILLPLKTVEVTN